MSDGKVQIGIYKIEDKSIDEMATVIEEKHYRVQTLIEERIDGFKLKLYHCSKPSSPKWKDFFFQVAQTGQDILQDGKSYIEGFVFLVLNEDSENLYAITGGIGYFAIQEHIYNDFGIDVLSRLVKKEDKILKATREQSVVGGVLGSVNHFRYDFNLFETDSFGKIYQELKAKIDRQLLVDSFGFNRDEVKREPICIAKSSFKINKAISIKKLLIIIRGCESVIESEDPIVFNNVEKIIKKKNQALVNSLDDELIFQLWERYLDPENPDNYSFDLCHKDFDNYLTASRYEVRKGTSARSMFADEIGQLDDIDHLFSRISGMPGSPNNKVDFAVLVKSIKIYSYDEEDKELTKGTLLAHILGDVSYRDKKYFFIDKVWYHIRDSFVDDLNASCKDFIKKNYYDGLDKNWDYPSDVENDYNRKYIGAEKTIVVDKITPDNIEPCDIIKWDEDKLYLCHVKAGFGNKMRDLCSQVVVSADRISRDTNSSKEYIKKIYFQLRSKIGGDDYFDAVGKQTNDISEEDFLALFDKELCFVLAVLDTATDRTREIVNIEQFKSNIAKFSLQELNKEMRGRGLSFKITQIKKH